jgi:hypothetical protein
LALATGLRPVPAFAKDLTVGFIYVGPKDAMATTKLTPRAPPR